MGRAIAERLADERNSVTMVDLSSDVLARLSDELDVATVMGHGSHPDVLDRAGAADCDILLCAGHCFTIRNLPRCYGCFIQ